jgi:hypothetical protein
MNNPYKGVLIRCDLSFVVYDSCILAMKITATENY